MKKPFIIAGVVVAIMLLAGAFLVVATRKGETPPAPAPAAKPSPESSAGFPAIPGTDTNDHLDQALSDLDQIE